MDIKKIDYFKISLEGNATEIHDLLNVFSEAGIGLLAFRALPAKDGYKDVVLFPDDSTKMKITAKNTGLNLIGPYPAIIIKSNTDEPGECAGIFKKLAAAGIIFEEASGIADIFDSYGVVLYLKPEDCDKALIALKD